jgi:hypothetical protein
MVRTRTSVMSAEAVAPATTLGRRIHALFAVLGMRGRVNQYSIFVDVRAVLNKLRFAIKCSQRFMTLWPRLTGPDKVSCEETTSSGRPAARICLLA